MPIETVKFDERSCSHTNLDRLIHSEKTYRSYESLIFKKQDEEKKNMKQLMLKSSDLYENTFFLESLNF